VDNFVDKTRRIGLKARFHALPVTLLKQDAENYRFKINDLKIADMAHKMHFEIRFSNLPSAFLCIRFFGTHFRKAISPHQEG